MRQMRRLQRKCFFHIIQCTGQRLFRQRIHQIQVQIDDPGILGLLDRTVSLGRVVDAADALERSIVETLHAETDAVDAGTTVIRKRPMLDRAGIGFLRDLDARREIQPRADAVQDARDSVRREQARCAPTEKNRLQFAPLRQRQVLIQVAQQRSDVLFLRQRLRRVVRIEIAVRAFAHAPGDVDVERQWR